MKCKKCGYKNEKGSSFCVNCGSTDGVKKASSVLPIMCGIVVVLLVVLAGLATLIVNLINDGGSNGNNSPAQNSSNTGTVAQNITQQKESSSAATATTEATTENNKREQDFSYYKRYMTDRFLTNDKTFMSDKNGKLYGPQFALCDVNGDGRDDLIISGALGLRSATFTDIIITNERDYVTYNYTGTYSGVDGNVLEISSGDYSGAGETRYTGTYVYMHDKNAVETKVLESSITTKFYDSSTKTSYPDGKVTSEKYYVNGGESTKDAFQSKYQSYTFKEPNWVKMSSETIAELSE